MTTTARSDRAAAAVQLLGVLYPEPLRVVVGGDASAPDLRATWLALPAAREPRLLVPAAGARASTRSLRRQLSGRRLRTRVARVGLGAAVATGLPSRLSSLRIAVRGPADAACVEDPLREALGVGTVRLTLPIGPARANRKPVLQVGDAAGRVLAFAKVGHNPLTRALVRHEADALERLATGLDAQQVRVPSRIAATRWRDLETLVMEAIDIPSRRLTGADARERLVQVVAAVAAVGARPAVAWGRHPHRQALQDGLGRCGALAGPLGAALDRLDPETVVPVAAWHGDLNPGNIAVVAGPCPVWDWERFGTEVPAGFDLLHHDLHEAITMRGQTPRAAATDLLGGVAVSLAPLGLAPAVADLVACAYLLTLAERYLGDAQDEAGADLGRVGDWLVPALDDHLRTTGAAR